MLASQGHREKGLAELKQAAELYQQLGDELGKVQVGQLISAASNGQPQPQKLLELTP